MLNRYFKDKDKWKKDTFDLIKSDLLSIKNNRFVQYNQSSSTHLVCVYGKSQVGKTTLILNMIGLKEEWKKDVSDVLRGGVAKGNSSTSTAIIYSQNTSEVASESDKYGLRIETLDSSVSSSSFDYFSSDEMENQLKVIRDKVENNEFSTRNILHISIPYKYFSHSANNHKISILDLPGVESRNMKEQAHVESLMTRYIPLASVCIIACPSNIIQSLEKEEILKKTDWKKCAHKYLLVLTKSYSDGSIKSYFNIPRKDRDKNFEEFVKNRYQTELSKVIGNNNIEIYPLDLGDSFDNLLSNEIHDSKDCEEIRSTRDSILLALQESIVKHKGEQLLSIIKELHVIVEHSDEIKIKQLQESKKEIEEEIDDNHRKLDSYKRKIGSSVQQLDELQRISDHLSENRKEIEDLSFKANTITQILVSNVRNVVDSNNLSTKGYLNDPKKICLTVIIEKLTSSINELITKKAKYLVKDCNLEIELYTSEIANPIYYKFIYDYKDKLYPPQPGIIKRIFGNTPKVSIDELYRIIQNIKPVIEAEISNVISSCISLIDKENKENQEYIGIHRNNVLRYDNKIQELNASNTILTEKIEDIKLEIENVEYQKECDKQTLKKYLKYCEIAYLCQRDDIIKKINSNVSKEERILYLLLLGVIDKEYNIILNTSNE